MKIQKTLSILLISLFTFTAISCKDEKKEDVAPVAKEIPVNEEADAKKTISTNASDAIVENYLKVKDALVADNQEEAASAGKLLVSNFQNFDKSQYSSEEQQELADIIEDAQEHADHIAESPIDHQREHFDILSKDVIDLIAITGTGKKLYQAFCPMFNNNKGAQWLSTSKDIQNPYYGSKMMDCGEIQKEIN